MPRAADLQVHGPILGTLREVEPDVHSERAREQVAEARSAGADRVRRVAEVREIVDRLARASESDERPALHEVPAHFGLDGHGVAALVAQDWNAAQLDE